MGIPVLILGESGTGKSAGLRNFESDEIAIFNVASKPLPFKSKLKNIANTSDYEQIMRKILKGDFKTYVIDDSQYMMAFEFLNKVNVKGYDKFTEMAVNFVKLVQCVINQTPKDCIVYFLHHTETNDSGKVKAKTIGKMLDEKITLEGLFSIVLRTKVTSGKYFFTTQTDGNDTCKSPMEMFETEIENDLKFVDETIREFYELNKTHLEAVK